MITCRICRFDTELDDVAIPGEGGWCICVRCFARETNTTKPMPKWLRRELSAALAAV
jgi:hypothetical protein